MHYTFSFGNTMWQYEIATSYNTMWQFRMSNFSGGAVTFQWRERGGAWVLHYSVDYFARIEAGIV